MGWYPCECCGPECDPCADCTAGMTCSVGVTISGMTERDPEDCGTCDDLNGYYVAVSPLVLNTCAWRYTFDTAVCTVKHITFMIAPADIRVELRNAALALIAWWRILSYEPGFSLDCESWDGLDIPFLETVIDSECQWDSATCTITSL